MLTTLLADSTDAIFDVVCTLRLRLYTPLSLPSVQDITKTYLYNFDPLKPHFYIVNWALQGYTLFILFLLKNIECGYSLEPPRSLCFEQKCGKYQIFIWKNSVFFLGEIFYIFE